MAAAKTFLHTAAGESIEEQSASAAGLTEGYADNKKPVGFSAINNKTPDDPVAIHGNPIDKSPPLQTAFVLGSSHPAPHG